LKRTGPTDYLPVIEQTIRQNQLGCVAQDKIDSGREQRSRHLLALGNRETNQLIKFLTATLIAFVPAFSMAQQGGGTEQEREACSPDVKRYCAHFVDQGDLVVLGCLKENRPKLSSACNKVLVDHGQ
jgi:hypothetical protein